MIYKKRDLEKRALELLMREDETMDEIKYGDVERDAVQRDIENVVWQYKEVQYRQKQLDFMINLISEAEAESEAEQLPNDVDSESYRAHIFDKLMEKIQTLSDEIGYDVKTKEFEED